MFQSFIQAGFECSTHRNKSGKRLDLLRTTQHDRFVREDYERLKQFGIQTIRTAARWHLIEESAEEYRFHSLEPALDAAEERGMEVILDLLHFGWPDRVQVFRSGFVSDFAKFTRAFVRFIKERRYRCCRMLAPVNEISYLSWAGGDKAAINPHAMDRGSELKRNLVRAAAASSEIILNELPDFRLVSPEPVIHIVGNPENPGDEIEAANYRLAQFEAWDMLSGRIAPELGGRPEYVDIIGVNFYWRNEWVHNEEKPLSRDDPRFRPFHEILREVWERYQRPMFVAETGTEDDGRAEWFNYVCNEVATALAGGIPVHGICLYPILNHPGWDDDRYCQNGLFDYAGATGSRAVHWPLADAIRAQEERFTRIYNFSNDLQQTRSDLPLSFAMGVRLSTSPTPDEPICTEPQGFLS